MNGYPSAIGERRRISDLQPWFLVLDPWQTSIDSVGLNASATVDPNQAYNGYRGSTAQNDYQSFDVLLGAGTWDLEHLVLKTTDAGIVTYTLDGAELGAIDTYAGAAAFNSRASVPSFDVRGVRPARRLTATGATKNASSTGYRFYFTRLRLRRTA